MENLQNIETLILSALGFVGFILGLIVLIYILSTIPKRLKLIIANQMVINTKLNEIKEIAKGVEEK